MLFYSRLAQQACFSLFPSPPPINYALQGSHAFDFRICSATLESLLGNWDWRGLLRLRHFFFFVLHREFIIDSLSVERNHVLVRVGVVGGPSERTLPARALQEVSCAQNFLSQNWWLPKLIRGYFHFIFHVFFWLFFHLYPLNYATWKKVGNVLLSVFSHATNTHCSLVSRCNTTFIWSF